jgi:hypothetical protein
LPALLYVRAVGPRRALAGGLLQAVTLTFPIVAAQIGLRDGRLTAGTAAALVGAGLLSAALFPAAAARLLGQGTAAVPGPRPAPDAQAGDQAGPGARPGIGAQPDADPWPDEFQ